MRLTFKGTPYLPEYRGFHDGHYIHVPAGGTVEVSEWEAAVLLQDFPGVFIADLEQPPVDKQLKEPPVHKQIKTAPRRK